MNMEESEREQVSNSIKEYLYQFESYSKAIAEIQKMCDIPQSELEKLPNDIQRLKREQRRLSSKIIARNTTFKDLINQEKQNVRKIERAFRDIADLKAKLLDVDEKLKSKGKTADTVRACTETGPEIKQTLSTQYKHVLDVLSDVRKQHPKIYSEVENETGIHFFTPLA
ncbi:MAG: hypothetical protein JW839_10890 [Candidatus Lokiarchaeota archaeon]|nr:hypothetical protein [Candidatus Lokiarchaeota archaeon]